MFLQRVAGARCAATALHRRVAMAAASQAMSVNSWIADALEAAAKPRRSDAGRSQKKRRAARKATG